MFCKGFWESTLFLSMDPWAFYMIRNGNSTYAGISTDVDRRLRQHNGEIRGGARYTTGRGPGWKHLCIVRGFKTRIKRSCSNGLSSMPRLGASGDLDPGYGSSTTPFVLISGLHELLTPEMYP